MGGTGKAIEGRPTLVHSSCTHSEAPPLRRSCGASHVKSAQLSWKLQPPAPSHSHSCQQVPLCSGLPREGSLQTACLHAHSPRLLLSFDTDSRHLAAGGSSRGGCRPVCQDCRQQRQSGTFETGLEPGLAWVSLCGCPAGSWRRCPRSSRRRPSCPCTGRRRPRCRRRGRCTRSGSGPAWWPSGCRRSGRCAWGCISPPSTLPAARQLLTR